MAYAHSSKLRYDPCAYKQDLKQSTDPLAYYLYPGQGYNCNGCRPDISLSGHLPGSLQLVDVESELWGLTRINSECTDFKFPNCGAGSCIDTFDRNLPGYISPWACERDITPNNIRKATHPGFEISMDNACQQFVSTAPVISRAPFSNNFYQNQEPVNYYYSQ